MKASIITLFLTVVFGLVSANAQCCKKKSSSCDKTTVSEKTQAAGDVQAYYFHGTRRCATCQAVESVTRGALKEYYGDKVKFSSINREEEKANALVEKYKISGQTLLIIKGGQVINLTQDAFLNARSHPDRLKAKIKATIDAMI